MKFPNRFLTALAVGTIAASSFGSLAKAEIFTLRIGSGHPSKPVAYVRKMEHYFVPEVMKRVSQRTKHKIKFIQAYAGTVAKVHETLEAVEKGLLDIGGWCVCFEGAKMMPYPGFLVRRRPSPMRQHRFRALSYRETGIRDPKGTKCYILSTSVERWR